METYKDPKSGATITRTIMKDGTVASRRVSKNGKMDVSTGEEYSLYAAAREVSKIATVLRPHSQAAIILVTDGIIPIILEDRNATADLLVRSNVTFNSLTVSMRTLYKFLLPFAKPVGNWIGMSFSAARSIWPSVGGEAGRSAAQRICARLIGSSEISPLATASALRSAKTRKTMGVCTAGSTRERQDRRQKPNRGALAQWLLHD